MGITLYHAAKAGWVVTLKCDRRREGLKSARPCLAPTRLHLPSLIAALGPDIQVDDLQKSIRCPRCGSDRFELGIAAPPPGGPSKDEARAPRRMQPARSMVTLATSPDPVIVFKCDRCGRRGEYRKETLLKEFDGDIQMPSLLSKFAFAKGCTLAIPDPDRYDLARAQECRICYDVVMGPGR